MKNLTDFLIAAIPIICVIGGLSGYIFLSPLPHTARSQQFKRSLLSSYLIVFGFFPGFLIGDLSALSVLNLAAISSLAFSMFVYFILGGALLTALTFGRIMLLERSS